MEEEPARRLVDNVLRWVGLHPDDETFGQLRVYAEFLRGEATAAGGIGPTEGARIWRRHIADSLTFLTGVTNPEYEVEAVVDVGSGVGLPGLPMAVVLPNVHFTLLDRSERRNVMARRAIRMLGLENVEVVEGDAGRFSSKCDLVVSRAALPIGRFVDLADRIPEDAARGLVAGSHGVEAPTVTYDHRLIEVPDRVLGEPVWLVEVSLSGRSSG